MHLHVTCCPAQISQMHVLYNYFIKVILHNWPWTQPFHFSQSINSIDFRATSQPTSSNCTNSLFSISCVVHEICLHSSKCQAMKHPFVSLKQSSRLKPPLPSDQVVGNKPSTHLSGTSVFLVQKPLNRITHWFIYKTSIHSTKPMWHSHLDRSSLTTSLDNTKLQL